MQTSAELTPPQVPTIKVMHDQEEVADAETRAVAKEMIEKHTIENRNLEELLQRNETDNISAVIRDYKERKDKAVQEHSNKLLMQEQEAEGIGGEVEEEDLEKRVEDMIKHLEEIEEAKQREMTTVIKELERRRIDMYMKLKR